MTLALAAMAVAACTAPIASANWTHKGAPIEENVSVSFTGQALFTSAVVGGINCRTFAEAQFVSGTTTGTISKFEVDLAEAGSTVTNRCETSGPLGPCRVSAVQSTNLPWQVHSNGADLVTITTGEIDNVLESPQGGACGVVQQIRLTPGTVTATIPGGQTQGVEQVTLSGQLETATKSKVAVGGSQTISPAGTYGTA